MTEWLLLATSLLLMLACGVFVAAEFSFVTVDRATIERDAAAGDKGAQGTLIALRSLSTQLSGAQLGITITNLAIGYLAEPAIGNLLRDPLSSAGLEGGAVRGVAYGIALVVSTVVTMLVGELVPKNFALALPQRTAALTQLPQRIFTRAMAWPIRLLNGMANSILRMLGVEPQEELRSARSPVELRSLVLRSAVEGAIDDETADLVARSIAFGDRTAADVRTPRVRVHFLEGRSTALDVIEAARQTGHSRFPVIGRTPDDVLGIVHVKRAVGVPVDRRRSVRVTELIDPATTVPDSIELDPLLLVLRDQGMQMAIVVDEYGGTDGVVTLEDLVEEIVGDIADEHDRLSARSRHRRDGTWSLSGLLRPDEVEEQTGVALPESENYETIAGLVHAELGRIAVRGDVVTLELDRGAGGDDDDSAEPLVVALTVDRMEGRRIDRVSLTVDAVTVVGEGSHE
ncbi:hemolysin family protein [Aeromicrobium fastidiosum]|uniref:HlyC/CorC family transporter n=1 Tax=Aeromicrobium fastidiosum TaxID=52699 RepID=A0A641AP14_9ACTN|nr:hemolysin family protein [Aeromicrobium fastidiosum]KAA1379685.1 HlyC/CorC family transporter [Aeromicrobium fastidiosum]MBP2389166.1 CBS domain containing-hemolysin-like protein [Aeromicrobium fastidiosum]